MKHARRSLASPAACGGRGRQAGFSLVELMVASTLGMIVALVVTGAVLGVGRQTSSVGASVTAQAGVQVALAALGSAATAAGVGLYSDGQPVCRTWNAWNGSRRVANGDMLMPARIVPGADATASDTIIFTGSRAVGPSSTLPVLTTVDATGIIVGRGSQLGAGDAGLIGVPGGMAPCTLFQVSAAPQQPAGGCGPNTSGCVQLPRSAGVGFNAPAGTFGNTPAYGYMVEGAIQGPAVVVPLGPASGFGQEAFTVQCNTLVRYDAFANAAPPGCTQAPLAFGSGVEAVAGDVVALQAQYGVSDDAASHVVTSWQEPTGTWNPPSPEMAARIKALRLVVVTRAPLPETQEVSEPCSGTNGTVANANGPCSFPGAGAPVIDLSATPVPAGRSWRHYRYRVLKTVLPLTAVLWGRAA